MNAIMDLIKGVVSYVEDLEFQMLTTARNVQFKKKIEMDVLKLLILEVLKQTYFMKGKSMVLKEDDITILLMLLNVHNSKKEGVCNDFVICTSRIAKYVLCVLKINFILCRNFF